MDAISLTLEAISGAISGGMAGYLGANAGMEAKDFSISPQE